MMNTNIWAVLPAAGIGARVGAGIPKQYIALNGVPMLARTLEPFLTCAHVAGVVVALAEDDRWWADLQLQHPKLYTCIGGADRASSVLAGIEHVALMAQTVDTLVMVHDAARPCLTAEQLSRFVDDLKDQQPGGLWAVPVAETLKRKDAQQRVLETVDREQIWRAQTPQMFPLPLLSQALKKALAEGATITDEASAIEYIGLQPLLLEGPSHNIKVTYPSDVALAEFFLQQLNGLDK